MKYTYRGYTIQLFNKDDCYHVRNLRGELLRPAFPTDTEAEEYIDELIDSDDQCTVSHNKFTGNFNRRLREAYNLGFYRGRKRILEKVCNS